MAFNTLNPTHIVNLPQSRHRDYEIIFDDLEFAFTKEQLRRIQDLHNDGIGIDEISKEEKRNEYEVLLSIIHMHKRGWNINKIFWRD